MTDIPPNDDLVALNPDKPVTLPGANAPIAVVILSDGLLPKTMSSRAVSCRKGRWQRAFSYK
jgi:hypothetical protein